MTSRGVFDLKGMQQSLHDLTVLKDHRKETLRIRPVNQKVEYSPGDIMTFNLKGQGLEYINLNGSLLFFRIMGTDNAGAFAAASLILNGAFSVIDRQEVRIGEENIEDYYKSNGYMQLSTKGGIKVGNDGGIWYDQFSGTIVATDAHIANCQPTTAGGRWFNVPFRTCLDAGGYLPIYNLAESLEIRFTFAPAIDVIYNAGAQDASYRITDAYLLADGVNTTSGAILNQKPFRFKTHFIECYRDQVTGPAVIGDRKTITVSHPIHRTSVNSWMGAFFDRTGTAISAAAPAHSTGTANVGARLNPESQNLQSIEFSMNGKLMPYNFALDSKELLFTQLIKYMRMQDNTLNDRWQTYLKFNDDLWWNLDATAVGGLLNSFPKAFFAVDFEVMDQTSDIVSGMSTIDQNIEIRMTGLNFCNGSNNNAAGLAVPRELCSYYTTTGYIQFIDGAVTVEK